MTLRIGQLVTTCHVPRRHQREAELVDLFARGRFGKDLAGHLGPSLSRQPAIVRIRLLPLRVIIPASELNEDSLSSAWTQAFSKALFTALAYPTGAGPFEVFRADSVASFVASAIRDLLEGTASTQWQYAEFEHIFRLGSTPAALELLSQWPWESVAILTELAKGRVLERLLARFDELALERLFTVLARPEHAEPPPLSIADLMAAAKLVLRHAPEKFSALRTRGYALRLYVEARRIGESVRSPRAVFHSLLALAILLSEDVSFLSPAASDEPGSKRLPPAVPAVLEVVARQMQARPHAPGLVQLNQVLSDLRIELKVPLPPAAASKPRWISSDWCGLFFLAGTLDRLGWTAAWNQLSHFHSGGISCLLAGLAMSIVGKFEPEPRALDDGIALFSGYTDPPDLAHLRRVFQEYSRDARLEVLGAASSEEDAAVNWAATFDQLAETLLHSFASRIRGFRQATRQSIVRTFIAIPGRVRIEPDRIVVVPEPSPFHVALRIAGLDAPIEGVSWLRGRRLEFELGNL